MTTLRGNWNYPTAIKFGAGHMHKYGVEADAFVYIADSAMVTDAITLHVPSKADGTPVLGADEFAKMKPGVILVNTARGNSIDEDALIAALKSGKVKSAGLDVYMNEPTPRADIMSLQNVSLSPHIGAATLEAQERIGGELAELLMAWREEVTVGRG